MLDMKKALTKLMQAPIVVETGTSGNWTYRKWSNGTAECWGLFTLTATLTAFAGVYRGLAQEISYPSGLFPKDAPITSVTLGRGNWTGFSSNLNTKFKAYIFDITAASNYQTTASVYAIGKWK